MELPPSTNTPTATSVSDLPNQGLCHNLPQTHHLDKRVGSIVNAQPANHHPDDLLTTKQLAEWFEVSKSWIDNLRSKGGGPRPTPLSRRSIRYKRSDVLAWLESRRRRQ